MYVKRAEREREAASWEERENDRHGWRKGKEWETTPERLRGEPAAPSQHSSSLPVCFAMVTRQGSQCSQLMCFSVAGASGVLMCLGPSPTQSMSTVLGCTNTGRTEDHGTLGQPGHEGAARHLPWRLSLSLWIINCQKPDGVKTTTPVILTGKWLFFYFVSRGTHK